MPVSLNPHIFAQGHRLLRLFAQDVGPMANGQFPATCYSAAYSLDRHLIWRQSPGWHFRSVNGGWSYFRPHGRYLGQSNISVSRAGRCLHAPVLRAKHCCSAYPHWAIFAACEPEKPCITPGTYAFLGAAAALG